MSQNIKVWKISLILLFGLFVFIFILLNTVADVYYLTNPVIGIYSHYNEKDVRAYVQKIVPGSPADLAGIKAGDWISAINDHSISGENRLAQILKNVEVGKNVELTINRDGQTLKISVFKERLLNVYTKLVFLSLLPGVIFCYALIIIGTFVFLQKIHDRTARIFYFMVLFWALAMWHSFPFSYNTLESILPGWYDFILLPFWPLAVSLLLHFTLVFPLEKRIFQRYPKIILSLIYLPVFMLIPYIFAVFQELKWADPLLRYGRGIGFSVNFFLAMFSLGHSRGCTVNPHVNKQAQIMFWGTMLSLAGPTGLYYLPRLFFNKYLPYSEFILLLVTFWPIILAYAIIKHRFMDIDVIIKRGVAYALMSGFVIAAYFLLVVGLGKLVLFLTGSNSQIVTIIATLVIAAIFNPVKNKIRNFVDRRFYPSRFTYREAIRSINQKLINIVDLQKLFDLLQTFLYETMQIKPITILWQKDNEEKYTVRRFQDANNNQNIFFTNDDAVIKKMQQKQQLIDLSPLKAQTDRISEDEKKRWDLMKTELILPLLWKDSLIGIISLGAKEQDEPYYKEDIELLETLGDQINISLKNTFLTEELREQERMKKELEVARRIQMNSLPQSDPQIPGLDISGISIPALEVGGDYYDYLDFVDGRFGIVVGDVSGKGTSAALYMSQLKGILKTASKFCKSLKDLMIEVNSLTYKSIEEKSFITLTCGVFDLKSRKFKLIRAGHLPLIHFSAKKNSWGELIPKGIGIGLEKGTIFNKELEEVEIKFNSGDIFLFYTDGIDEVRNLSGDEFNMRKLIDVLHKNGWDNAYSLRKRIISEVEEFSGDTAQKDDMTLVVAKVL